MITEHASERSHATIRRAASAIVALVGAFLIVFPLATSLPGKSSATGDMMTAFRPAMSTQALAVAQDDQATMAAMGQQLTSQVLPALAAQMRMTPAQLSAYLASNFPSVGQGLARFDTILAHFGDLQTTMRAQQSNYRQADQIPTGFLPPTSMTWLFVVPGAVLLVLGGLGVYRPRWSGRLLAAGSAVGLGLVVGLLSVSMYAKASAADSMTAAFKPVFAAQSVQQTRADTDTVTAMSTQLAQQALPALATALGETPTQLEVTLAQRFPVVASGLAQMPQIVQRMQAATGLIEADVANYDQSASIPWSPGSMVTMFWLMMVPALLALVAGLGALALTAGRGAAQRVGHGLRPGALHG
jgi:hypothetical protein